MYRLFMCYHIDINIYLCNYPPNMTVLQNYCVCTYFTNKYISSECMSLFCIVSVNMNIVLLHTITQGIDSNYRCPSQFGICILNWCICYIWWRYANTASWYQTVPWKRLLHYWPFVRGIYLTGRIPSKGPVVRSSWGRFSIKMPSYQYRIPMLKIGQSRHRLIFNMGIHIPRKTAFMLRRAPDVLIAVALNKLQNKQ